MPDLQELNLHSGRIRIRKPIRHLETVISDGKRPTDQPVHRAVVWVVREHPYAVVYDEELLRLQGAGGGLGDWLMRAAPQLLPNEIKAHGRAGVVGEHGELEHITAILHPQFGQAPRTLPEGSAMLVRDGFDSIPIAVPDSSG